MLLKNPSWNDSYLIAAPNRNFVYLNSIFVSPMKTFTFDDSNYLPQLCDLYGSLLGIFSIFLPWDPCSDQKWILGGGRNMLHTKLLFLDVWKRVNALVKEIDSVQVCGTICSKMVSWELQGRYCWRKSVYGNSTLLVLNGTALKSINAFLAFSRWYMYVEEIVHNSPSNKTKTDERNGRQDVCGDQSFSNVVSATHIQNIDPTSI